MEKNVDPPDGVSCVLGAGEVVSQLLGTERRPLIQWIEANVRDYPHSGG